MAHHSDTYCSLCDFEALTPESFFAHLHRAPHLAEALRVQADSLDLLLDIRNLLKNLVERGGQATPPDWRRWRYLCYLCQTGSDDPTWLDAHAASAPHRGKLGARDHPC